MHRQNFFRLLIGKENKVNLFKKKKKTESKPSRQERKDIKEENLKIHKLTNQAYMIEIKDIPTEKKNEIKEEIKIIECTIYKTTDTLKDLKQRQENRELIKELQERKAEGEAI